MKIETSIALHRAGLDELWKSLLGAMKIETPGRRCRRRLRRQWKSPTGQGYAASGITCITWKSLLGATKIETIMPRCYPCRPKLWKSLLGAMKIETVTWDGTSED